MAWTKVKEQGWRATSSSTSSERTASRFFIAISDAPTTSVAAEHASAGTTSIPVGYAPHPDDASRRVKSVTATPDPESDRKVFTVEVQYSNKLEGELAREDDPLARPDDISFDGESELVKFFLSEDSPPKPIVTSAGEMFAEFQELTAGIFKLIIEGNRRTLDAALCAEYLYPKTATNSASFTVRGLAVGTGQAKMVAITAAPTTENAVEFLRVRWELAVALDWDLHIDDRGYHEKHPTKPGKLKEIMKGDPPVKVDKPWPLNGKGQAMPNATDAPAVLNFKRYPRKPFGVFGWTR